MRNNKCNFAYIAFQRLNRDEVNIFYFVDYPEYPIEVDLENFVTDIKISHITGDNPFEVALLKNGEARKIKEIYEKNL